MFKAVFFDLDDTLVGAMDCHWESSRKAFDHFGYDFDKGFKMIGGYKIIGKRVIDGLIDIQKAFKLTDKELPIDELMQVREEVFLECVDEKATLYPGAEKALRNARKNTNVVSVVSSGTEAFINASLRKFDLLKYVDFIVSAEDVERGKPFLDPYNKAFKMLPLKLKIQKDECLVVEDSANGVKSGRSAGMKVLLVPSKYTKGEIDADWRLKSLEEFDLKKFK